MEDGLSSLLMNEEKEGQISVRVKGIWLVTLLMRFTSHYISFLKSANLGG